MKYESGVFDSLDQRAEADADARGIADIKSGRVVSHEAVKKWLTSWGSNYRLPRPKIGD